MRGFCLEVNGDFACFTRPEMKAERVSYEVITPSAARAIFEAILWKPSIRWRITKIEVLAPIKWMSIKRNEVKDKASPDSKINIEDSRTQRSGLILRDVRYRLYAEFDYIPIDKRAKVTNPTPDRLIDSEEVFNHKQLDTNSSESEAKYAAMFERRASKGQCFHRPYLGCREFSCQFHLIKLDLQNKTEPINETKDLGWMLYDMNYTDKAKPNPMLFRPYMKKGIILIPNPDSEEVIK